MVGAKDQANRSLNRSRRKQPLKRLDFLIKVQDYFKFEQPKGKLRT